MALDRKALLKNMEGKLKFSDGGDYLKDGIYENGLEIRNLIIDQKRSGPMFIAEFIVLSSKPTGEVDKDGKARLPHPAGSKPSFVVKLDDTNGLGLGNMGKFLAAVEGVDPKSLTEAQIFALAEGYTDADQPARGMIISDATFNKPTKGKGTAFTHHRWANVAQTPEEIMARRAVQEGKAAA